MQIKNYKLTANEIIEMVQSDPKKAYEVIADLVHEYNSMPCGLTWKVSDPVKESTFIDNDGKKRDINNSFAYVKYREDLSFKSDKLDNGIPNTFIIGDNYHALQILQDKYKSQFGFIYCDVPYNTGKANEFKYNDKYIDKADPWRDAKWLSFINKRFRLIRKLLRPHGILAVSIDDYEVAQLILLMDEIFGRANRLAICPVEVNPSGKNRKGILIQHEYLLLYTRDINKCIEEMHKPLNATTKGFVMQSDSAILKIHLQEKNMVGNTIDILQKYMKVTKKTDLKDKCEKSGLSATYDICNTYNLVDSKGPFKKRGVIKTGKDSEASARPTMAYTIYYDPNNMDGDIDFKPIFYLESDLKSLEPKYVSNLIQIRPIDSKGALKRWSWSSDKVIQEALKGNNLMVTKSSKKSGTSTYSISYREYAKFDEDSPSETLYNEYGVIIEKKFGTKIFPTLIKGTNVQTTNGTNRLKELIGDSGFGYPKPVGFIVDILKTFTSDRDIVGDFFVGSGTTMEAVFKVNEETGKNLRFITCTNNENNIAYDVTLKRLKALKGNPYDFAVNVFEIQYEEIDVDNKDDARLIESLCNYTQDYYKFVYNVTREVDLNNPNIKCFVNDYDGVVVMIAKDRPNNTASGVSFGDFLNNINDTEDILQKILNNIGSDIFQVVIRESDIKTKCGEILNPNINLEEIYPCKLIETIKTAQLNTEDKSILFQVNNTTSEDDMKALLNNALDLAEESDAVEME